MRWSSILIAVLLLAGCDADLKVHANGLEQEVASLETQVHVQEMEVRDLERQLDDCQKQIELKAVDEILAEANIDSSAPLHAVLHTSHGDIRIELLPTVAPRTVANFVGLAEGTREWIDPRTGEPRTGEPLYRNVVFHRVIADYIVQCGDPLGSGFGGPGYSFPDEFSEEIYHSEPGIVSMANSGPDTNGSQFFITLDVARHLDTKHSRFVKGVEGLEVAAAISRVPAGKEVKHQPNEPVILRSVTIER